MIRVLVAEDQAMVLGALSALLDLEDDIEVVARARDGEEALRLAERLDPDIVLTDIEMPRMTGLELAARLVERGMRVIILTTFARAGYLRRALDAGVRGYLLKDAPAEELAGAVRQVRDGGRAIAPELAAEAWCEADPLTDRERQVLRLAGEGVSGTGDRGGAASVGRHGPKLPVRGDQQARRIQPGRSRAYRPAQGLALMRAASEVTGLYLGALFVLSLTALLTVVSFAAPGGLAIAAGLGMFVLTAIAWWRRMPTPTSFGALFVPWIGFGLAGLGPQQVTFALAFVCYWVIVSIASPDFATRGGGAPLEAWVSGSWRSGSRSPPFQDWPFWCGIRPRSPI